MYTVYINFYITNYICFALKLSELDQSGRKCLDHNLLTWQVMSGGVKVVQLHYSRLAT